MFSNKKSIQNIENELLDDDLMANTSSSLAHNTVEFNIINEGHADSIYEFTFDPAEETLPPSKQTAPRKKAKPKPKVILVNNNYETNVLKTLQTLKKSIKRNSLDADDKENCNKSPELVAKHESLSPELTNISPNGNKKNLKKKSPNREDKLLREISFENTPKVSTQKHPKASPWRAEIEEITPVNYDESNYCKEKYMQGTKSKKALTVQDSNSTVVENTEPKLKQPRLLDFIKQSSEKSMKYLNDSKDSGPKSNNTETVVKSQILCEGNTKSQEKNESVNLFEELDVIPSVKPCRRSYGKKETPSPSIADRPNASDSKLMDFSEELSAISTCNKKAELKQAKKQEHKTKLTRQEEDEVNAWAEAFNSMCEDVDDFPLVVE